MSPQTGTDLVGAGYPISRPLLSLFGGATNTYQSNVPVKTNLDYQIGSVVDGTAATTGVSLSTPVPVLPGDVITKATYLIGATAASPFTTGTNNYAFSALYNGFGSVPALIGTSSTLSIAGGAAVPLVTGSVAWASTASLEAITFTYGTPVQITSVNAPYGFVYADVNLTLSAVPTLISMTTTASCWYQWFTNGPTYMGATHDTAAGSTAPNPMGAQARVAKAPVVFLQ